MPMNNRRGFSLLEMAIVIALFGMILGGVWLAASSGSLVSKVEQSSESISLAVENTRNLYQGVVDPTSGSSQITGGVAMVVPLLVTSGAMPTNMIMHSATQCQDALPPLSQYAASPWGNEGDPCGSFRLCAWVPGTGTPPNPPNSCALTVSAGIGSQYISVEFAHLDTASCISLAVRMSPVNPAPGLTDVYINGASMSAAQAGVLPTKPANATVACTSATANIVDFIYTLRAPTF